MEPLRTGMSNMRVEDICLGSECRSAINAPREIKISNVRVGSLIIAANPSKGRGAKA